MLKTIMIFIFSVFIASFITTVVSSQIVLADVQSFGIEVTFTDRLSVTISDLVGLGPTLLIIIGLCFLVGFIIAKYAHQYLKGSRSMWFIVAGFSSLPVTLFIIKYFMGVTILASARTTTGLILVACCCAIGGWIFAQLSENKGSKHSD